MLTTEVNLIEIGALILSRNLYNGRTTLPLVKEIVHQSESFEELSQHIKFLDNTGSTFSSDNFNGNLQAAIIVAF